MSISSKEKSLRIGKGPAKSLGPTRGGFIISLVVHVFASDLLFRANWLQSEGEFRSSASSTQNRAYSDESKATWSIRSIVNAFVWGYIILTIFKLDFNGRQQPNFDSWLVHDSANKGPSFLESY